MQILPRFLYDNACRQLGATISYSGTTQVGFEPANAFDWRDFSIFRADGGTVTTLDVTVVEDAPIDCAGVFVRLENDTAAVIDLALEMTPGLFPPIASWTLPDSAPGAGYLRMRSFNQAILPAGRRIRWTFSGAASDIDIRQLACGTRLDAPTGQHSGIKPPVFTTGIQVDNVISINGSVIGRSVKRLDKSGSVKLQHLDPDWARTYWEPLLAHAKRWPFFYQWNPVGRPDEVAMAYATDIPSPSYAGPPPLMEANLPLRMITE